MIVLGIDPGCIVSGYGVLEKQSNKVILLDYGFLKMSSNDHLSKRVSCFYSFFKDKIDKYAVQAIALETPFMGKNAQNFLKLGYLRGLLYLLADQHGLRLFEFSPREVKQSLTGFGGAEKALIAKMVLRFFPDLVMPSKLDVTDALAVALCGLWMSQNRLAKLLVK